MPLTVEGFWSIPSAVGTGSNPDGPKGRQRESRLTISQPPVRGPKISIASWAYSEQEGKNLQGDGWPGRSDWYQRMARNMACWALSPTVVCCPHGWRDRFMAFGPLSQEGRLPPEKGAQTRPLQANAGPQRGTNRAPIGLRGRRKGPAVDVLRGFAARHPLPTDQWHSQHGGRKALDRSSSNTTDH